MTTDSSEQVLDPKITQIVCKHCDLELPLYTTSDMDRASIWLCASCNSFHLAYADPKLLPESGEWVRLQEQHFVAKDAQTIPFHMRAQLASIVQRTALQNPLRVDRRRSPRIANPMMITGVEMDDNFIVQNRAINLMMVDVSREGIGLALVDGTKAPYLALQLPSPKDDMIQVVARVVRQHELMLPYVNVGCEFVTRLGK